MYHHHHHHGHPGVPAQPQPSYQLRQHACLTLNFTDRLRLIQFPSGMIDVIRQAIVASWRRGIQEERTHAGAYEFKLIGNPWTGLGPESVDSRVMMTSILATLHQQGWYLVSSVDVSKKEADKDTLIFVYGVPPPPTTFFAVSFNEGDKLRLIGAPPELVCAVQQSLGTCEIQREEWVYSKTAYQFKLRGYPWFSNGDEAVTSRMKLLALLDNFTAYGWQLHASVDMSVGHHGGDTDTWFFRRNT